MKFKLNRVPMLIEDFSIITCREEYNKKGEMIGLKYNWVGKSKVCIVNTLEFYLNNHIEPINGKMDQIMVGPFRLKYLQPYNIGSDEFLYIRQDSLFSWAYVLKLNLKHKLRILKRNIIQTAWAWDLAELHEGYRPLWTDIYFIKRIEQLIKKVAKS